MNFDTPRSTAKYTPIVRNMRIACLQFAPQVGEVDNNLNRADAVLAKANQDDVDGLDLLVLPELAFSGMIRAKLFLCNCMSMILQRDKA